MEFDKKICPIVDVDGVIASGKQFDVEIVLPEDNRHVIFGVIKDCYKEPICNAVVKLIEVEKDHCREERKPVSQTFTDEHGEFVFGPLCPNKFYEILVWVNQVKHVKVCAKCKHEGKCLKGVKIDQCDFKVCKKDDDYHDHEYDDECKCKHDDECKHDDKCKHDDECKPCQKY